nr:PREDICTED: basic salivary proline-rich protein 1-like [Rhinolophus sinicus]
MEIEMREDKSQASRYSWLDARRGGLPSADSDSISCRSKFARRELRGAEARTAFSRPRSGDPAPAGRELRRSWETLRGRPSPLLPALPETCGPELPAQGPVSQAGLRKGRSGSSPGSDASSPRVQLPPVPPPAQGAPGFRPWGRKTRGVGTKDLDSLPPGARGCVPAVYAVVACRRVAAPGCRRAMAQRGKGARRSPLTRSDPGEGSLTSPDPRRLKVPRRRQRPAPRLLLLPLRPARLPGCPRGPPCGGGGRPPGCCYRLSGSATSPQAAIAKPQGPPSPPGPAAGGSINNPRPFILAQDSESVPQLPDLRLSPPPLG